MQIRIGTHQKYYNYAIKKENETKEKSIYKKWEELYKTDKSAYIEYLGITIYPKDIYSLKKDQLYADRMREYFNKKL